MRLLFFITYLLFISSNIFAQELFVYTEPASNMAKGNLGLRFMTTVMKENSKVGYNTHIMPEVMYGINSKLMIHGGMFLSNRNNGFVTEGGTLYAKYKFLNHDEVKRHFRMATFFRYSFNFADIHQEEVNLIGHNTGLEIGINATQLLHKVAISGNISTLNAFDNGRRYEFPAQQSNKAIYYTLSVGKLMLPKKYKGYQQTNVNLMCELLAQTLLPNTKTYVDIAPSIQFIVKSKMRFDIGYRRELGCSMLRTAPNGILLRIEYNFYNVK